MPRDISQCITPAERMILPSETSAMPIPCWVLRLATRLLIWPAFPRRCHAKGRRSGTKRHQPSLGRISIVPAGDGHFPPLLLLGLTRPPQYGLILCAGTIHTCPSVCRRGTVAELRELHENLLVEVEKVRACLTALVVLRQIAGALVQWSAGPASSFSASPMPWEQPRAVFASRARCAAALAYRAVSAATLGRPGRCAAAARPRTRALSASSCAPLTRRGARFVSTGTTMRVAERAGGRVPTVRIPGVAAAAAAALAALAVARLETHAHCLVRA